MSDMNGDSMFDRGGDVGRAAMGDTARHALRLAALVAGDAVLVWAALQVALQLRYEGDIPTAVASGSTAFALAAVAATVTINAALGVYRSLWRFAGVHDVRRILLAGVLLTMMLVVVSAVQRGGPTPRTAVMTGILSTALIGISRLAWRLSRRERSVAHRGQVKVAVLGAGDVGTELVREMRRHPEAALVPVALLDDDPRIQGWRCSGVRVLGPLDLLPELATSGEVDHAVLAMATEDRALVQRVTALADSADVPLRVLPSLSEIVTGNGGAAELEMESLIGRRQVHTSIEFVRGLFERSRVLITGAGGSIGSEIARQVARCHPEALILLDHDETHLFDVCADLDYPALQVLADVRDEPAIRRAFERQRPTVVLHAAAHKHVPVLEDHVAEAILTNVVGTRIVADAAVASDVTHFVFVSTDKAVNPRSVMGASKRLAEHIVLSAQTQQGRFCAVRFGNVLGSRGSVLPTFRRQLAAGGPLTVTDPRMTRFFMTIPEASRLILNAAVLAEGGEVFMLDMGEPIRIVDLARRMIRLAGKRPGYDVEIRIVGTRPGEKLAEQLIEDNEVSLPTVHPLIMRVLSTTGARSEVLGSIEQLERLVRSGLDEDAAQRLFAIVEQLREASLAVGDEATPRGGL